MFTALFLRTLLKVMRPWGYSGGKVGTGKECHGMNGSAELAGWNRQITSEVTPVPAAHTCTYISWYLQRYR